MKEQINLVDTKEECSKEYGTMLDRFYGAPFKQIKYFALKTWMHLFRCSVLLMWRHLLLSKLC
jgi:hypothetical protein